MTLERVLRHIQDLCAVLHGSCWSIELCGNPDGSQWLVRVEEPKSGNGRHEETASTVLAAAVLIRNRLMGQAIERAAVLTRAAEP